MFDRYKRWTLVGQTKSGTQVRESGRKHYWTRSAAFWQSLTLMADESSVTSIIEWYEVPVTKKTRPILDQMQELAP